MRERLAAALCRLVEWIAAWFVPLTARASWREKRRSEYLAWQLLAERGELPCVWREAVDYSAFLLRSAVRSRFAKGEAARLLRSAGTLVVAAGMVVAALALVSSGFTGTRAFAEELRECGLTRMVFGLLAPVTLALAAGLIVASINRPSLHFGWKYAVLLAGKLSFVALAGPVLLIESTALLRPFLPEGTNRWFFLGVAIRLAYIAFYTFAVYHAVIDQRCRCPVCLRRLSLPVRIGSWGSALDPPATEVVCDLGHGSLYVREDAGAEADTWTRLDPSWRDLFARPSR